MLISQMCKSQPHVTVSNLEVCDAVPKDRPEPSAFHQGTCNSVLSSTDLSDQPRIVLDVVSERTSFLRLVNQRYVASRRVVWK